MRAKRTLAFMLSFMMLFSNSVTAFAQPTSTPSTEETVVDTSVFGEDVVVVENDDGTITITPDEDGDENDDELSTPDIVDEEQGDEDLNPDASAVTAPSVTTTEETTTEEVTTEEVTTEEGTTIEELLLGESDA